MITKNQLIDAVEPFMKEYGRLPYMSGDEIQVPIDGKDMKYKSRKYVKGYFDSQQDMTDYLLDEEVLTLKMIGDTIDISEKRVEELINKEGRKVSNHERRMIDVFFNEDIYEDLEHSTSSHCSDCTKEKKCGQPYWVDVVSCPTYRKSKKAKK